MTFCLSDEACHRSLTLNYTALEDRLEVLEEIGDGNFGNVVCARVCAEGSDVAQPGSLVRIPTTRHVAI
jgi:hypothetical protein